MSEPSLPQRLQALIDGGQTAQAIEQARAALRHAEGTERAALLLALASACSTAGQQLEAMRAAVAASELYGAAGSREGVCDAMFKVGAALRAAGDHAAAIGSFEQAEAIARALDDPKRVALALRSIGICCSIVGRHQQALSQLHEALAMFEVTADQPADLLGARLSLLNAQSRQADSLPAGSPQRVALAEPLVAEFMRLAHDCAQAGQLRLGAMARGNHAIMLREAGRQHETIAALNALVAEYERYTMRPNVALSQVELGHAHRELGALDAAVDHYERALVLLRDGGSLDDLGEALEGLSLAEEARGHTAAALAALREWCGVERRKSAEAARGAAAQRELRIELARLTSQWARQAAQDPLTGLSNRRALDRWMGEHLPRVEDGQPLTLLLLDLDHFKQVNDRFGHGVGDEVLKRVATVLAGNCRSRDLAVRFGGEEFVLALASVDHAQAVDIAHRLRASIETQDWDALAPGLAVSVSIGVAQASEAGGLQALLALADQRLYAAKYGGRNQVVVG